MPGQAKPEERCRFKDVVERWRGGCYNRATANGFCHVHGGVGKAKPMIVRNCASCPCHWWVEIPGGREVGGCSLSKAAVPSDVSLPAECPLRSSPVKLEADPAQLSPEVKIEDPGLPVTVSAPPRLPCEDCGGRGCVRCAESVPVSERGG